MKLIVSICVLKQQLLNRTSKGEPILLSILGRKEECDEAKKGEKKMILSRARPRKFG